MIIITITVFFLIMIIITITVRHKQNENRYQHGPLYYKRVLITVLKKMILLLAGAVNAASLNDDGSGTIETLVDCCVS